MCLPVVVALLLFLAVLEVSGFVAQQDPRSNTLLPLYSAAFSALHAS